MSTPEDKNLSLLESELNFICRHLKNVEGAGRSDFETLDEIGTSLESAAQALEEYKLSLQPAVDEEFPAEIALPEPA